MSQFTKLFLLLGGSMFFMACSPQSSFDSDDQRFNSLMDGETVEVVDDQTLAESYGVGDDNLDNPDGMKGDSTDDGLGGKDYDSPEDDGKDEDDKDYDYSDFMDFINRHIGREDNGYSSHDDGKKGGGKKGGGKKGDGKKGYGSHSCHERLVDEDKKGRRNEMMTCPGEMHVSDELFDAIKCNDGEETKKVYICHFPNGDFEKRQTKCLPIPAVRAHVRRHMGEAPHKGHADFAGACRDEADEIIPPCESCGDDDEDENKEAESTVESYEDKEDCDGERRTWGFSWGDGWR